MLGRVVGGAVLILWPSGDLDDAPRRQGPRAGGLTDEVVALGDVRRPAGGVGVRRGGGRQIAAELV
jgi:hypothetical protein